MIIGRKYEQQKLQSIFQSQAAEFVAVYGRRRIGKTHLVREFFTNKRCIFFRSSGIHKASLKKQLSVFKTEIENTFYANNHKGAHRNTMLSDFSDWQHAFASLTDAINLFAKRQKVVIFLDEIPWMATAKSGLLEALDYYWNRYWSEDARIKLIICGSAASWIIDNVLHNTGGLHNRVTLRLPIEAFTLAETQKYLQYRKINYKHEQILNLYLCLGGIPFYLNFVEKGLSAIQNVSQSCFNRKGTLYDEFSILFASLFKKHEEHEKIITFIASKRNGVSRTEIESHLKYKGGRLTNRLKELEESSFILSFAPWKKNRGIYYKVIDEYTLFYLSWVLPRSSRKIASNIDVQYWDSLASTSAWQAWAGYAFEAVCFKHIRQIMQALKIPNSSEIYSWRLLPDKAKNISGAQIDLIFDRPDNIINLCEIKHCNAPFVLDKQYASHMLQREQAYCTATRTTNKQIFHSIIAAGGIKKNMYSEEIISSCATLSDLFR